MKLGNLKTYKSDLNENELKKIGGEELTKEQKMDLTVSNIYGFMGSKSDVTKEEIREEIKKFWG